MSSPGDDLLTQYQLQLSSVEESLKIATDDNRSDLLELKTKLTEVISLLQGTPLEASSAEVQNQSISSESKDIDDEFLKFQQEINELEGGDGERDSSEDEEEDAMHDEFLSVLSSMEGSKCRAPFSQEWGEKALHNALIFATDSKEQSILQDVTVKVMFCNPTCDSMKPCPFFLDGHCKFSDEKCRFSHGYDVKFSDLEEYVLPDYSHVQRDSKCLAKCKDGLWLRAVVESCLENHKYLVKYINTGTTASLDAHDILPLGGLSLSDDDTASDSSSDSDVDFPTTTESPVTMDVPFPQGIDSSAGPLGSWEQHTKGIGSKLMAKMGYVWGQGLGKDSNGRVEPVEAIVLPKGKSLDKCVAIRESHGLESVEERFNSEQKKELQKTRNIEEKESAEHSVFDFLNKNISRHAGSFLVKSPGISLKRPSDSNKEEPGSNSHNKDLNFEMYSVGEAIKKTKKEIIRLQQSVNRNSDRNEAACSLMKQKMAAQSNILKSLEAREQRISNEINKKKTDKKIAVF